MDQDSTTPHPSRGVYGISVAAELSGVRPQALRMYERKGLIDPARTDGGTRRYSEDDLDRLRRVTDLVDEGVNLAGVKKILQLQDDHAQLHTRAINAEDDRDRLATENATLRQQHTPGQHH